jgi:hypothetical protein
VHRIPAEQFSDPHVRSGDPERETPMRLILGMILGAILLAAGAYYHDSMTTSTVATGPGASENRPMVNWDVVETNWKSLKVRVQEGWADLRARINRA